MPPSKEEILQQKTVYISESEITGIKAHVFQAMDEYAKQEAIGMAQWATLNDYTYLKKHGYWVNEEREERNERFTDDQMYQLYLKYKANATK